MDKAPKKTKKTTLEDIGFSRTLYGSWHKTIITKKQEEILTRLQNNRDNFFCLESNPDNFTVCAAVIKRAEPGQGVQGIIITPDQISSEPIGHSFRKYGLTKRLHAETIGYVHSVGRKVPFGEAAIGTAPDALDYLKQGYISTNEVKTIIITRLDEIEKLGYLPEVSNIIMMTHPEQIIIFSKKITKGILFLIRDLKEKNIKIYDANIPIEKISHQKIKLDKKMKLSALAHLLKRDKARLLIVFCNKKSDSVKLSSHLKKCGLNAEAMPTKGSRNDKKTQITKSNQIIIVCAGSALDGVYIDNVANIYSYDPPHTEELYRKRLAFITSKNGKSTIILSERQDLKNLKLAKYMIKDVKIGKVPRVNLADGLNLKDEVDDTPLEWHLNVEISAMCNYNCKMCGFQKYYKPKGLMDLATFKKLKSPIKKVKSVMFGFNAETLLNPHTPEMLRFVRKTNPKCEVTIITNGSLLTKKLSECFVKNKLQVLSISLDGATKEAHERIRVGSNFDKVMANLEELVKIKKKYHSKLPRLSTTFVGMKSNLKEILGVVELAKKFKMESVRFTNVEPYTEEFNKEMLYGTGYSPETMKIIKLAEAECKRNGILFSYPKFKKEDNALCQFMQPIITYSGEVIPCSQFSYERDTYYFGKKVKHPFLSFGNINNRSFEKIWDSKAYKKFRKNTLKGRLNPFCRESCLLRDCVLCPK